MDIVKAYFDRSNPLCKLKSLKLYKDCAKKVDCLCIREKCYSFAISSSLFYLIQRAKKQHSVEILFSYRAKWTRISSEFNRVPLEKRGVKLEKRMFQTETYKDDAHGVQARAICSVSLSRLCLFARRRDSFAKKSYNLVPRAELSICLSEMV